MEQVIHADKYAVDERAAPQRMPDLGLALGAGWQQLGTSSVSELDLRELFAIVGRSPDRQAAAGWGGGRFELWRRGSAQGCAAPCVERDVGVMLLSWDTRSDRRDAERALGAAFPKGLACTNARAPRRSAFVVEPGRRDRDDRSRDQHRDRPGARCRDRRPRARARRLSGDHDAR